MEVNYPPTAPRNFLDKIAEAWQSSPSAPLLGALLSASIQLAISLSIHVNSLFEPDYLWWIWVSTQSIVLLFRRRAPFLILIIQCIFMISAEVFYSAGAFCLIPLLISVHSTSSRSTAWKIGAGLLLALAADFPASWKMFPIYGISAFLPTFFYVGTISTISLGARFRKLSLARQDDVFAAEHHARLSENKRLQAERSTRIATSLHDSVGHSLTAIAALSEGVKGQLVRPDLEEALEMIDELARDALADTRRTVYEINQEEIPPNLATLTEEGQHTWNDLASLIEVTRKTGISVAFLENGKRTENQCIQELCFQVIRECTTNTIRHAQEASQITVSLDFSPHSVRIHFSDNGKPQTSVVKPGNGILGMRRRLEKVGGSLTASSTHRGWKVNAIIPIYSGSGEGNTCAERYR